MGNVPSRADLVHRNYLAFQAKLPGLMPEYNGKVAVMHEGEIAEFLDTFADAVKFGQRVFGDNFSVQEVSYAVHSLGFHSHAFGDVR